MLKKIFAMMALAMLMGCSTFPLYSTVIVGPDGPHRVTPFRGTRLIRVYNRCASMLIVTGVEHRIRLGRNEDEWILLPVLFNESEFDPKDVVFDARDALGNVLGTKRDLEYRQYASIVEKRQLIVGGRDADVRVGGACDS
ncbi:hypothetical protein KW785_03240 [Candidatus Parcubacteria bacterium]|nr:hypothetical protein [Candidatus Parcubacteria bacterium]